MAKHLVIVESPAKARTIGSFLGSDYEVLASVGHIRDLLPNAKGLPEEFKKAWWADFAVNVDEGFEPIYEVPKEKSAQVTKLKQALKNKQTLILATDEDREGESISWHLLQVLKPGKGIEVRRIAFHEITREAILQALEHPRTVDEKLVEAQETRRILDRLYGYTLSPVLWSRVTKNLSAGRVQSPAVKLIVDREELRRRFRSGAYWDLKAEFEAGDGTFWGELRAIGDSKVATGADFDDETGELKAERGATKVVLDRARAEALARVARDAKPWKVASVRETPGEERPAPPFMTTTLQQDANRKFNFSADRTMRAAQQLYEGIEIDGEPVGLITYMRTDSLTLSVTALTNIRGHIGREYPDCLPDKPQHYTSKVRNAQEAHEAIRPTDVSRRPRDIARFLNDDQLKVYELIWKRTVASQMKPARVLKTEVEIAVDASGERLTFRSAGKQILFDGFRRVYMEGRDDPEGDRESADRRLPRLEVGKEVGLLQVDPVGHETKPPARYTDATLIKKLEEMGIGRPSTYASIISTILDREYARKAGKQLVPTWKAFLTMEVLEKNFQEFMELNFTAKMDEVLDEISEGRVDSKEYLKDFFLGNGERAGLKIIVDERRKEIPYPACVLGHHEEQPLLVRMGKDGKPFLQQGEADDKKYANIPDDLAPADLSVEKAVELLSKKAEPAETIGIDPETGRRLLLKYRQGYYLEVERTPEEVERKDPPRWISLPPNSNPKELSQDDLDELARLPRSIGPHPESGEEILFKIGKYGPYVQSGSEIRSVDDWRKGASMTVEEAVEILSQPKFGRGSRASSAPIKEFGKLDGAAGPVRVLSGRFGPYVTDGEVNATLPKDVAPESVTEEQATEFLRKKREAGPSAPRSKGRRSPAKAKAKPKSAKPAAPRKKK
jgi:DNA topoisomerase I